MRSHEIRLGVTDDTMFQQRWLAKKLVRGYHGDFINEKAFQRWYLPELIPDVRPPQQVAGETDTRELMSYAKKRLDSFQTKTIKEYEQAVAVKGMAPVGSLMFSEVERRIDVFLFRCCFVHSVYEARRLVIHGRVMLNGRKVC